MRIKLLPCRLVNPVNRYRLHAATSTVFPGVWACFHLWEQWALFDGKEAWLARMHRTSTGWLVPVEVIFGLIPLGLWTLLHCIAIWRRESIPGQASWEEGKLAFGLGWLVPLVSPLAIAFVLWHALWLWGMKAQGAALLELSDAMERTVGLPWALVIHAFGLFAFSWHLAAALPDGLEAMGLVKRESKPFVRPFGVALALALFVSSAQLIGWIGTGSGTFWPLPVEEVQQN
ncbi:MAG: hypothetical protein RMJ84_09130 [Sandaracinaceae bacterium]|nr:hypothetical protein [Sandaracinaceae bacterium]